MFLRLVRLLLFVLLLLPIQGQSQPLNQGLYDIGAISVVDYYVDPANGSDANTGRSRSSPKRTVTSIWNGIPTSSPLSEGVRINLLPGTYSASHLPNYWELRSGTAAAPIIVTAADGYGTVFFTRDINMAHVSYFYLMGVAIANQVDGGYGDAFHGEGCDHILLRRNSFNGAPQGIAAGGNVAHETIKFNQSQHIYIENNSIQGAGDNGIDWVAVQYGHIRGNRIHDTGSWCAYVKGGSSYVLIESNLVYDCGEGGITVGQGTGFEFMTSPWLQFEANYIKVVNNILHDIQGAALGVNGGYNVLLAHNTAYRVGARSHLLEIIFGERSCDGNSAACATRQAAGGWGPTGIGSDFAQPIGNRSVLVYNNLFYNPPGYASAWQHLAIHGPRTPSAPGIPSPQRTDIALSIKGNFIWNGSGTMPLGIEDTDQGCQDTNPTCDQAQIQADNIINSYQPQLVAAATFDFRPAAGSSLAGMTGSAIPSLDAVDTGLTPISEGDRGTSLLREFSGMTSSASRPPGALVNASSLTSLPTSADGESTPDGSRVNNQAPTLSVVRVRHSRNRQRITLSISARATDDADTPAVRAQIRAGTKLLKMISLRGRGGQYAAKVTITTKSRLLAVTITARDRANASKSRRVTVRA